MIHPGFLLFTAGALALTLGMLSASADTVIRVEGEPAPGATVVTRTVTQEQAPLAPRRFNQMDFDIDRDGILSTAEVGDSIFKLYDADGNDVIDNIEFERRAVMTVVPMVSSTAAVYDFDNDGFADRTEYSYETFMAGTQLSRFDRNLNGLSAREFAGMSFTEADADNSKVIEPNEWRGLYIASLNRENREDARFNK